jgi:hypothetical protein
MEHPSIYRNALDQERRKPFPHRPWITGKVYDDYIRNTILHCDVYVFEFATRSYLVLDWREGGFKRVALDGYLIDADGLTPVWNIEPMWRGGKPRYWTRANHALMSRIHRTALAQGPRMLSLGTWARVVVHAHYVRLNESDTEPGAGGYKEPKPYAPRGGLPDWL